MKTSITFVGLIAAVFAMTSSVVAQQNIHFQAGDVLVGRNPTSKVPGFYKHVAICDGAGSVIEAMPPGGIRQRTIEQFWADWPTIVVQRLSTNSTTVGPKMVTYARDMLGRRYSVLPAGGTDCVELVRQAYIYGIGDWRIFWYTPDNVAYDYRFYCVGHK